MVSRDDEIVGLLTKILRVLAIQVSNGTSVTEGAALVGQDIAIEYASFAPKAAIRYEITPRTRVFANVSRSIDTPSRSKPGFRTGQAR